jgi:hypothetical protein
MLGINGSGSFEEATAQVCAELKAICDMAEELVGQVMRITGTGVPPDAAGLAAVDEACHAMIGRQETAHALLARQVADIAASLDQARAALEARDVPRRSDLWIGRLSKPLMRRRMVARSGRSGQGERLLQVLGRCDRLAGIVGTHRSDARGQRDRAEDALASLIRRDEEEGADGELPRHADIDGTHAMDRAAISFSAFVDARNLAIGDHTVLLNKLTFDVENALEIYNIFADMGLAKDDLPRAEAYPHVSPSIERLAEGILPGGRLVQARHAADRAFAERFGKS